MNRSDLVSKNQIFLLYSECRNNLPSILGPHCGYVDVLITVLIFFMRFEYCTTDRTSSTTILVPGPFGTLYPWCLLRPFGNSFLNHSRIRNKWRYVRLNKPLRTNISHPKWRKPRMYPNGNSPLNSTHVYGESNVTEKTPLSDVSQSLIDHNDSVSHSFISDHRLLESTTHTTRFTIQQNKFIDVFFNTRLLTNQIRYGNGRFSHSKFVLKLQNKRRTNKQRFYLYLYRYLNI